MGIANFSFDDSDNNQCKILLFLQYRTYELKVLGQIKTVYPKAYIFQQEKCLSSYGNKTSSYELTIEADLSDSVG